MDIPKTTALKHPDWVSVFNMINLDRITFPFARLVLQLFAHEVSLDEVMDIRTPAVIAEAYPWSKELKSYIVEYIKNDRNRIGPEYFFSYTSPKKGKKYAKNEAGVFFKSIYTATYRQKIPYDKLKIIAQYNPIAERHKESGKEDASELLTNLIKKRFDKPTAMKTLTEAKQAHKEILDKVPDTSNSKNNVPAIDVLKDYANRQHNDSE